MKTNRVLFPVSTIVFGRCPASLPLLSAHASHRPESPVSRLPGHVARPTHSIHRSLITIHCLAVFAASAFAQGSLTPPGAPAPTLKTLQQVEPRTDLQAPTLPPGVTTDANYHFIINQSGSYYLSSNLDVTKPNGIDVRAEGVTLDLNGFEIRRTAGSGGNGIEVDATSDRCTIKNGSIKSFSNGLNCLPSYARAGRCLQISVSACSLRGLLAGEGWLVEGCAAHDNTTAIGIEVHDGSTISNCTASANTGSGQAGINALGNCTLINCASLNNASNGINAGPGSTVTNCSASGNLGNTAIFAGNGSTLTNCSAYLNPDLVWGIYADAGSTLTNCSANENSNTSGSQYGIHAESGCILKNCSASSNAGTGTVSGGIDAFNSCTLVGCVANSNTNTNATASGSTGFGIRVGAGSTVRECGTDLNKGAGIQVTDVNCQIVGNTCTGNTTGGGGAGVHLTSAAHACRVDGNHCVAGTRGFLIEGNDNLIVRNSTQGATVLAYDIVAGNHDAARVTSPGAAFASTSPWVNFSY